MRNHRCPNCDRLASLNEALSRQLVEANAQLLGMLRDAIDVAVISPDDQFGRIVEKNNPQEPGDLPRIYPQRPPRVEANNEISVDMPHSMGGMGAG